MRTPLLTAVVTAILSSAATLALLRPAGTAAEEAPEERLETRLLRWDEAKLSHDDWGDFRLFFRGEGYGANRLLAAFATVKPGKALHAAHRHHEEEFLVITEGAGTWSIGGKDIPLRKGDVLYVEPWASHGCTNTGTEPLTFFVARWAGKGVPLAPDPEAPESAEAR